MPVIKLMRVRIQEHQSRHLAMDRLPGFKEYGPYEGGEVMLREELLSQVPLMKEERNGGWALIYDLVPPRHCMILRDQTPFRKARGEGDGVRYGSVYGPYTGPYKGLPRGEGDGV